MRGIDLKFLLLTLFIRPVLFTYRHENLMKLDLALMTQGDANEDPSGDIAMDDFTIDSISTSEIFIPTVPAQQSSRPRNNSQQQHQPQRRPTTSSTAGSSNSRSQRSFHTRTTVAASAGTDGSFARSNGSATTIPVLSSENGYSDAGSNKNNSANNGFIPPIIETDDEVEEPLFRKNPLSSPRPVERTEVVEVERDSSRATDSNIGEANKVAPTGQRLTTLQNLRLKHQMRNAAAAASSTKTNTTVIPAAVAERSESRRLYDSDEERENLLSRMKYENTEMTVDNSDNQPRKVRKIPEPKANGSTKFFFIYSDDTLYIEIKSKHAHNDNNIPYNK